MKMYTWTVKISVDEVWVADGFDLTKERITEMVESDLCYAIPGEVECEVIEAPDPKEILEKQGG
jgi:hypothetical protein